VEEAAGSGENHGGARSVEAEEGKGGAEGRGSADRWGQHVSVHGEKKKRGKAGRFLRRKDGSWADWAKR
jgi:hypothetical protein